MSETTTVTSKARVTAASKAAKLTAKLAELQAQKEAAARAALPETVAFVERVKAARGVLTGERRKATQNGRTVSRLVKELDAAREKDTALAASVSAATSALSALETEAADKGIELPARAADKADETPATTESAANAA